MKYNKVQARSFNRLFTALYEIACGIIRITMESQALDEHIVTNAQKISYL